MKNLYKITAIAALLVTTSCNKYLDINSNPAVPQSVQAQFLLPPIEFQMANCTAQDYQQVWKVTQNLGGTSTDNSSLVWEQHTSTYPANSDVGGVIWRMTYANLGLNLESMINDGVKNQKYEYAAIGYAIKAWSYQMCTDLYGPIILDEAYTPNQLTFHYQDQPDVYAKVREWSYLALKYSNMKSPLDYSAQLKGLTGDEIYGGDMAKWRKFVYAVLALQYSHLINKPEFKTQYADSVSKFVDLSFVNDSEDATIFFNGVSNLDSNPLGPQSGNMQTSSSGWYYGRPTTTILNYLTGGVRGTAVPNSSTSVDPRLSRLLIPLVTTTTTTPPVITTTYIGTTPTKGSSTSTVPAVYGAIPSGGVTYNGHFLFADKARYPLMSYAQLQFAKSEAKFIQGNSSDAYAAYLKGILGHMDFCNLYGRSYPSPEPVISSAEITAYMTSSEVAQNSASLTIADIMGQKYIAEWGWAGLETWCDIRKYHYSATVFRTYYQLATLGGLASVNGGKYAYRFRPRYNSEYVWNSAELAKWGGLTSTYMTQETWFSQP